MHILFRTGAVCFIMCGGAAQADEAQTCFDAVQDKVAWDTAGNRAWNPDNVAALCRGVVDHRARIGCFEARIREGAPWQDAIARCIDADAASGGKSGKEGGIADLGLTVHRAADKPKAEKRPVSPPRREFLNNLVCTTTDMSISQSFEANYVGKSEGLRKVLVPGAVFHLNDLLSGSYAALGEGARRPYDIYVNFNDRTADLTGTEDDLFAVADRTDASVGRTVDGGFIAVQSALASIVRSRPFNANFASSFELHEISSDAHLNIALNGAASYNGFSMDGTFGFDSNSSESKLVGQFIQRYYGVSVDFVSQGYGPEAWFSPEVVDRLRAAEATRGPLVYIDSVVYGRAAYFFTETKASDVAVKATLNTVYTGAAEASASASADFKSAFASDELRVVTIGAGNEGSVKIGTADEFKEFVSRRASSTALGDAIAYTLRFVDDNSIAMTNVATTYKDRTCTPLRNKVAFGIDSIKVNVADDEGTDNAIEIVALGTVMATYDAFEKGAWVQKATPLQALSLNVALGDSGSETKGVDRYLTFELPDDPASEDVNEVKTARFDVRWSTVYEDDSSSAHDVLSPQNSDDGARTITLNDAEKGFGRPFFRFRGADQQYPDADVELRFSLRAAK